MMARSIRWGGLMASGRRTYGIPKKVPSGESTTAFATDGIESAVEQAKAAAGKKNVGVLGASTAQQCLSAGLVDEIYIHLAPILLGDGKRLFDHLGKDAIKLESLHAIAAPHVTHLGFRVVRR
jgi:dihydrofolate reductase